jgi:PTH1 family peptidyl-tRNA hydrolase
MNRHNIGFMALDSFLAGFAAGPGAAAPRWREEHKALTCRLKLDGVEALFAKPQAFMNKSGEPVRALLDFYKIDLKQALVIHDDVDQPFGSMRVQVNRGHGGQNGVRDIHEALGTSDYARIKLGIGRPAHPGMDVAAHVLQNFSEGERDLLPAFLNAAGDAIETAIFDGFQLAATRFNKQIVSIQGPAAD